jgi:xanthine dehydrogenase accessory factor
MNYSLPKLLETLAGGEGLVLAKIIETKGSAPQVPGASAIFSAAGLVAGTVGGGLLEARVEAAAIQAFRDGKARLLSFDLAADPSDREGAICGGTAAVLVDPGVGGAREVFRKALEGSRKRRPGYLAAGIRLTGGEAGAVEHVWLPIGETWFPEKGGLAEIVLRLNDRETGTWPRLEKAADRLVFVELLLPLPRLIIAGAGHVGRAVARLGKLLDFGVTVIDDRPEFANAENIPEADEIVVGDIAASVGAIEDSPDNYFVVVTRGHQKDAEALFAAVGRPAAYVGMIGSERKIEVMRRESVEGGRVTAEQWAKVRAPIGLDIGSKTVEEIAVSIAAELVLVRSGGKKRGGP